MSLPLLVFPDPLVAVLTHLRAELVPRVPGVHVGTRIPQTGKSLPFVLVRNVGSSSFGYPLDRPRVDFHCYALGEFAAQALAQIVRAISLRMPSTQTVPIYGAREFSGPIPADDPDWPESSRYYFTLELITRGEEIS